MRQPGNEWGVWMCGRNSNEDFVVTVGGYNKICRRWYLVKGIMSWMKKQLIIVFVGFENGFRFVFVRSITGEKYICTRVR